MPVYFLFRAPTAASTLRSRISTLPIANGRTKWIMHPSAFLSFLIASARASTVNGHSVGNPQDLKSLSSLLESPPSASPSDSAR